MDCDFLFRGLHSEQHDTGYGLQPTVAAATPPEA